MKTNVSNKFGDMFRRGLNKGEVRYWPARDTQGRFAYGEGGNPEVKRRKIEAAVREAHRRILDNPNEMGRAAYDAAAGQGLSGHDAHEVFQLVDRKMRKEAEALAKEGTSEGAKKGWETRRGGGDSPEDKPSKLMSPQLEDVVRRGYVTEGVVDDPGLTTTEGAKAIIVRKKDGSSASYLSLLPPTKQDPNWTVGSGATAKSERKKGLWSAITSEAAAFAQSQGTSLGSGQIVSQENKAFWEKLTSAGKAVRQDEHHYIFVGDAPKPEKADKTLEKAGTSEGAKLGWETRRGGGTQPERAGTSDGKAILDGLKEPITNLDDAIKMLREGKGVMFDRPDHAVVLLDKMAEAVKEAKDKGEKAPVFDLCKVMVKGSSLFCHQNMKIPRDQMPQLSGTPQAGTPSDKLPRNKAGHVNVRDALLDSLAEKGIKIEKTEESAGRMRASQNQMDGGKVGEMLKSLEKGTLTPAPLFISKENYVVDGHHGWAATVAKEYKEGKEIKIPVYRVDMPILDLLKYTTDFSSKMGLRQKEFGKSLTEALFGGNRVMGAFPMTQEQALAKAGTSEGAILGWQTRRTGGKGADPEVRVKALEDGVVHLGNLDSKLEAIVNDETAEIDREGENNRRGIPTDYVGMARRQTERRQEGYRLLKQSIETLKTIKPKTKEDADLVGNLLRYAEKDAERASREESEIPWDKQFDLLLTLARGATERAAAAERAELRGKQ